MAEYLKIMNDNQVTVIDDKYMLPKLLGRKKFLVDTALPLPPNINQRRYLRPYWNYQGGVALKRGWTLYELGFNYDTSNANIELINSRLMAFGRSIGTNEPFEVLAQVIQIQSTGEFVLSLNGRADKVNQSLEGAVYAFGLNLVPSKVGLHAYAEDGTLIFDAMRGTLQNIGILEGSLNMGQATARSYTIQTPAGLDSNNIFISFRSRAPYYAGYNYSSSGVSVDDAFYVPRMTINPTNVVVDLVRTSSVGKSTAYSIGGYFENVIYIPQEEGVYI